jgi:hypothetical protein
MAYDITKLQVASLDYSYIVNSLINFLEVQPELTNIDFRNKASAANMIVNILATATAYNGIYTQMGLKESFLSTASLRESIVGIASNHSILLPLQQSAKATGTTIISLDAYTNFDATASDGSGLHFYNVEPVEASTEGTTVDLYAGSSVITYTQWDFDTQSFLLPHTIDPNTISLYEIPDLTDLGTTIRWTKVSKSAKTAENNQTIFTVINAAKGYLVTTNLANARTIPTSSSVQIKCLISTGAIGNGASIASQAKFSTLSTPSGGYDLLSVAVAKAKVLFSSASERCVTLQDFKNAIIASGIEGTTDSDTVFVRNGDVPGTVNIYVTDLSVDNQTTLIEYLKTKTAAGISLIYGE